MYFTALVVVVAFVVIGGMVCLFAMILANDSGDRVGCALGMVFLISLIIFFKPYFDNRSVCIESDPRSESCVRLLDATGWEGK